MCKEFESAGSIKSFGNCFKEYFYQLTFLTIILITMTTSDVFHANKKVNLALEVKDYLDFSGQRLTNAQ